MLWDQKLRLYFVGPGTYDTLRKTDGKQVARAPTGDRYAALQKKLEDLERVHEDSKREVRGVVFSDASPLIPVLHRH